MFRFLCPLVASLFLGSVAVFAQLPSLAEHEAIAYSKSTPADPIARLQQKLESGAVKLAFDKDHGYLPSVLRALNVPVSSQGLVFSRTSLQVDRIAPWSPRAIYFNDDVYVGWVQGGPIMEIASVDPKLGAVFYTIAQEPDGTPTFERQQHTCLQCHDSSSSTGGVPGLIMRSVVTDRYGYPVHSGAGATTDQTPHGERWGGWYVTGTIGAAHKGNIMAPALAHEIGNVQSYLARAPIAPSGDITDLSSKFDTTAYLTPHSDAVALLVLAHQTFVHNLITLAGYEGRKAEYLRSSEAAVQPIAERLVRALLFVKAAPIATPVKGTSAFAEEFAAHGPRDTRGRSLRDLDLEKRLVKYPLSYLIYSDSFDALPKDVKSYVFRRLREILRGADTSPEFAHLTPADRTAILEILADTKPEFSAS
jgi:hypothetical protein